MGEWLVSAMLHESTLLSGDAQAGSCGNRSANRGANRAAGGETALNSLFVPRPVGSGARVTA
jgi:hypothetical protein